MNPLRQLAGQTAIYGLSSVGARILNFLLVPFYTRVFTDTAEYGIVNELYAYVAFFIVILTYGMETAFFRYSSKNRDKNLVFSTSLISLITTSIIFTLFILIFFPEIATIIGYEDQKYFVLLLGMVLSLDAVVSIPFARLRLQNRPVRFALIKLFNISVNILFNLFFLVLMPWMSEQGIRFYGFDLIYDADFSVGYVFVSNLLASFFTMLFFIREIFHSGFRFSGRLLRSMLSYAFPLLIAGLAGTVNEVIDRIMLRYRLPGDINALEQIGIYGANVKIAVLMTLFIQMFRYAFEPFFFNQEKNADSRVLYARVLHYFSIFGIFVFLIISLYIDIFKHIIGSGYHSGLKVVPVILLGNLMLGIYYNLSVWYKLKELTHFGALFAISGAIITLSVNYIFIPYFGYMASAWGHFLSYFLMVVISYYVGKRYFPVPYKIRNLFFYFLCGVTLYLLSVAIYPDNVFYRLILNTVLLIVYVLIVVYKERKILNEILNGKW